MESAYNAGLQIGCWLAVTPLILRGRFSWGSGLTRVYKECIEAHKYRI